MSKKKMIVLSGLSGSGNTTIIKELIDLNYFVLTTLDSKNYYDILRMILENTENNKIAVFLNASKDYDLIYEDVLKIHRDFANIDMVQVYLKAQKEELINRYQENRKIHPYIKNIDKKASVAKSIDKEVQITKKFAAESDFVIDTTSLFPKELVKIFKVNINESQKFGINLFSFGFKYGLFQYSDFVFDVRFLRNPYYKEELRIKSGEDEVVRNFVFEDEDAQKFLEYVFDIIKLVIPRYEGVDKKSVSISFGCTGGQHRSVSYVEKIEELLQKEYGQDKYEINKIHLEKEKGKWQ